MAGAGCARARAILRRCISYLAFSNCQRSLACTRSRSALETRSPDRRVARYAADDFIGPSDISLSLSLSLSLSVSVSLSVSGPERAASRQTDISEFHLRGFGARPAS